jgi:hypothetical protein
MLSRHTRQDIDIQRDSDLTTEFVNNVQVNANKRKSTNGSSFPASKNVRISECQSAMQVTCTTCDKAGHTAADCWSGNTCGKCGNKGHIDSVCRFGTSSSSGPAPKNDSRPSKVQQK